MSDYEEHVAEKPPSVAAPLDSTYPEAPALTPDTVDEFLQWAAGMPVGEVAVIRERIAAGRGDQGILDRLTEELWRLPVADVGRHHVLLSTLGELKDDRAAQPLAQFVWHQDIVARSPADQEGCGFEAHPAEVLQARAVEMLAFLASDEAVEETFRIAADHPSASVRAAAVDAHLFNHDDSPDEMQRLRDHVRADDQPLIGVPRFTSDGDPEEFERAVLAFYERHPEQRRPEIHAGGSADPPASRQAN